MKKLFFTLLGLLTASLTTHAGQLQGLTISGAPLLNATGNYNQAIDIEVDATITNNTGRTLQLGIQRQVRSEVPGSENYFCGVVCYTPFVTTSPSSQPLVLANGVSNSDIHFYYVPNGNAGITTIRYAIFEIGGQDSAYVTVNFDARTALGTAPNHDPESVLSQPWPNPAAAGTAAELRYQLPAGSTGAHLILVSLADGRRVRNIVLPIALAEGSIRLRTDDIAAGLYSCLLTDGRGQFLASRRLHIK